MKRLLALLLLVPSLALAQFSPGQVLRSSDLNAALAAPAITGGSINGAPVGAADPRSGAFTLLSIGKPLTTLGTLTLYNNANSFYTQLKPATSMASNLSWSLPAADSTGAQCLASNGAGVLSWFACASGATLTGITTADFTALGVGGYGASVAGTFNTALGVGVMPSVVPVAATSGFSLTGVGDHALAAVTTGYSITAVGDHAAAAATTGFELVAVGDQALAAATTASDVVAVGPFAAHSLLSGTNDVFIGPFSGLQATTAADAVGIGMSSLPALTTGNNNTAIGSNSLELVSTGSGIVGVGTSAGCDLLGGSCTTAKSLTTDTNMTMLGTITHKNNAAALDNSTAIGYNAEVTESNQIVLGNAASVKTRINGGHIGMRQVTVPTCSASCGTSPSVVGTDSAMTVTMGATGTPATPFTVTFTAAFANPPTCVAMAGLNSMATNHAPQSVQTTTTTAVVAAGTAPSNSDIYHLICFGSH